MMNQTYPNHDENRFVRHQLPLVLFAVALISFNLLLNHFLTSDNPRPDLAALVESEEAVSAETLPLEAELPLTPTGDSLAGSNWKMLSGNWLIENGALRQNSLDEFDQSIVYASRSFENYALDLEMRHLENIGGGVLFNMQREDSLAGSHLVRFEADGSALYWGYFDENLTFTGQGFAPISADAFQSNRFVIKNHTSTYDIWLNDILIAGDIPLQWPDGHVGLAVSQADVVFDRISVTPIGGVGTAPAIPEELIADAETITGEWIFETETIRQVQNDVTDYMLALNVLGKSYLLEATVDLGDEEAPVDNGAGFIIHMPDRDMRSGATMVRFMDHGQQILWGRYDENNVFQGSGNLNLDLPLNEQLDLAIRVSSESFDILVNEEERVSDVPLEGNEGWIGLVSFRGSVSFSNVQMNIGDY